MHAQKGGAHISGAERIVEESAIESSVSGLINRAMTHSNGKSDKISIKIELIEQELLIVPPLSVSEPSIASPSEAKELFRSILDEMALPSSEILELFYSLSGMRGAVLLDVKSMERLESSHDRGIRATCMDYEGNTGGAKNHFKEALCLSSKVAACPYIIGEMCISDDPDYTTGYFASSGRGYIRISNIKEKGAPRGGRIFLFSGERENVRDCIDYLENKAVFVKG